MPLIPNVLETQLLALFTIDSDGNSLDTTGPSAAEKAKRLSEIIDTYIKTATVNVTVAGTIVGASAAGVVTGTCNASGFGTLS